MPLDTRRIDIINNIRRESLDNKVERGDVRSAFIRGDAITNAAIDNKFRAHSAIVAPSPGPGVFTDIQTAIDYVERLGGGTVFIKVGTYYPDSNIILKGDVVLQGESATNVIIDFGGTTNQIIAEGENAYTTGTVSVDNGSTTVTGSGTSWTTDMEGQWLILDGLAFIVDSVTSATELEIDMPYDTSPVVNGPYAICDPIDDVDIRNFTVTGSTNSDGAVFLRYVTFGTQDTITVFDCTKGLGFEHCVSIINSSCTALYCDVGIHVLNSGTWTLVDWFVYGCDVGALLERMRGGSIGNFGVFACTTGISLTDCDDLGLTNFAVYSNTGIGIEVIDSYFIEIISGNIRHNGGDGIKFTSGVDRLGVGFVSFYDNGGYGMNVANANCNKNTITNCFFLDNSSGTINDVGTATIKANNQT
jgi:hypothetical protein